MYTLYPGVELSHLDVQEIDVILVVKIVSKSVGEEKR